MRTIEIDEEVFEYLQKKAVPFVEDPNATLRRLLLGSAPERSELPDRLRLPGVEEALLKSIRARNKKARLDRLVENGTLKEGQTLYLFGYERDLIKKHSATISGNRLLWSGTTYSMSALAAKLLKEEGHQSNSVRGPSHWATEDGKTITELWNEYVDPTKREIPF